MAIFDQEAEDYDKWYGTKMGAYVDKVETDCALSLLKIEPGMSVLDVGCGTGNFSLKLASRGASVTGIDSSRKMLEAAREKAAREKSNIEFIEMDALHLKFTDNTFDVVLSMAAIEFIPDYPKMISEMFRVCKTGGSVLVGTINRDSAWGKLYQKTVSQKSGSVFQHAHFRTPEELSRINHESLSDIRECLFISPDLSEREINLAKEKELSPSKNGGFFCILWKKP